MAHTVETLAKLLKKTSDEVIVILSNAGIEGKNASSEITADERKVLMSNLSKVDVDKAREALNKGQAQNIEQEEQDKKRKEKIEEQKKLQQENEANKNKTAKDGASRKFEKDEKDTGYNPREELHLSDEKHKRKLKKRICL
ncbi:MAG: translation initiation factor IF-2 N-terminal domain-containing protein [Gammaproteobacteria bacterium]